MQRCSDLCNYKKKNDQMLADLLDKSYIYIPLSLPKNHLVARMLFKVLNNS